MKKIIKTIIQISIMGLLLLWSISASTKYIIEKDNNGKLNKDIRKCEVIKQSITDSYNDLLEEKLNNQQ